MGGLDEETSHSWPTRQVTRTRHVPFQVQHACCQTALEDDDKVCSLEQTALRGRDNETTYRLVVHYVDKSSAPRATVPLDGPTCPVEGSLARLLAPVPRTESVVRADRGMELDRTHVPGRRPLSWSWNHPCDEIVQIEGAGGGCTQYFTMLIRLVGC